MFKAIKIVTCTAFCLLFSLTSASTFAEEGNLEPIKKDAETKTPSAKNADQSSERSSVKIVEPVDLFQLQQNDIKHYLVNENVTPVLAKTDEYLTLITPYKTEMNKGVVILMPDWEKGATNPSAINNLRNQLPDEGWTTIAVHPPAKPSNYPSRLVDEEKRKEENQKSLEKYQEKIATLMAAVMEKAQEYPGIFVVVAQGNNGAVLMNSYAKETIALPNALVLLSAYLPTDIANDEFSLNLALSDLPVLDLLLKKDQQRVITSAKQRDIKVKHELKSYYRQQSIYNTEFSYYPADTLRTSIIGWLKSIGW